MNGKTSRKTGLWQSPCAIEHNDSVAFHKEWATWKIAKSNEGQNPLSFRKRSVAVAMMAILVILEWTL
jgi:hypothetical protein